MGGSKSFTKLNYATKKTRFINLKNKNMKNLTELKNQIKNYFNYMFENKSKDEIAKYNYDSFLDFTSFLDEIKTKRFVRNIDINDFSDDEIGVAYDAAIEELLNLN